MLSLHHCLLACNLGHTSNFMFFFFFSCTDDKSKFFGIYSDPHLTVNLGTIVKLLHSDLDDHFLVHGNNFFFYRDNVINIGKVGPLWRDDQCLIYENSISFYNVMAAYSDKSLAHLFPMLWSQPVSSNKLFNCCRRKW